MAWTKRAAKVLQRLFVVLGSAALAFLVGEGIFRLTVGSDYTEDAAISECNSILRSFASSADDWSGQPTDIATDGQDLKETERRQNTGPRVHPYYGWHSGLDANGIAKGTEYFSGPKAEDNFDVLVVGGSVAGGFVGKAGKRLSKLLGDAECVGEKPVIVHGGGRAGYKQPQQLNYVSFLLSLGWRPDAVVNLDGFNEAAIAFWNAHQGAHPAYPSVSKWRVLSGATSLSQGTLSLLVAMKAKSEQAQNSLRRSEDLGFFKSAILGSFLKARIQESSREYAELFEETGRHLAEAGPNKGNDGPPFSDELESVSKAAVRVWEESSLSLHAICSERNIIYIHALQPTLHDKGSKTLTQDEMANSKAHASWLQGAEVVYPLFRERGEQLAKRGVGFVDLSMAFVDVKESLYVDCCHFTRAGSLVLAPLIAEQLAARCASTQ